MFIVPPSSVEAAELPPAIRTSDADSFARQAHDPRLVLAPPVGRPHLVRDGDRLAPGPASLDRLEEQSGGRLRNHLVEASAGPGREGEGRLSSPGVPRLDDPAFCIAEERPGRQGVQKG